MYRNQIEILNRSININTSRIMFFCVENLTPYKVALLVANISFENDSGGYNKIKEDIIRI